MVSSDEPRRKEYLLSHVREVPPDIAGPTGEMTELVSHLYELLAVHWD